MGKEQEMETQETGDEGREYKVQIDDREREERWREGGRGGWGEDEHGGGGERNIFCVRLSWSQEVVMVIAG